MYWYQKIDPAYEVRKIEVRYFIKRGVRKYIHTYLQNIYFGGHTRDK